MKVKSIAEHSAILLTCIKRYSVLKTNFDVRFERPLKTGFTVVIFFTGLTIFCANTCSSLHLKVFL